MREAAFAEDSVRVFAHLPVFNHTVKGLDYAP